MEASAQLGEAGFQLVTGQRPPGRQPSPSAHTAQALPCKQLTGTVLLAPAFLNQLIKMSYSFPQMLPQLLLTTTVPGAGSLLPEGWTSEDPVSTGHSPHLTPASPLSLFLGNWAVSLPRVPALGTPTQHTVPASLILYPAQLSACLSLSLPAPPPLPTPVRRLKCLSLFPPGEQSQQDN